LSQARTLEKYFDRSAQGFSPFTQADERVIFVGRSARMSERIMLFMIRELFASSLMLTLRARQSLFKFAPGKFIRSSHKNRE